MKNMAAPVTKVMRNGEIFEIHSSDLVSGDVVILETGAKIRPTCV
jgi:magnesium-transporting ATPase (P-type)